MSTADEIHSVAVWLKDEARDLLPDNPDLANEMYAQANKLRSIAERLDGKVVVAVKTWTFQGHRLSTVSPRKPRRGGEQRSKPTNS